MTRLTIIWDDMQAVRECGVLKWVPEQEARAAVEEQGDGTHVSRRTWAKGSARVEGGPVRQGNIVTRVAKVVPCECGTMRPIGASYHAAMLRERDDLLCGHGNVYWSDCKGRIPPPCCWEGAS